MLELFSLSSTDFKEISMFFTILSFVVAAFIIELACKYVAKKKPKTGYTKYIADVLVKFVHNYKIELENYKYTILLPIVLIFIIDFVFYRNPDSSVISTVSSINLFVFIFVNIVFQPILEEIFYRGILFGTFINLADIVRYNKNKQKALTKFISALSYFIIVSVGFLVQLIYFIMGHEAIGPSLIVTSILFSSFYLLSKKNLIPSITAHIANNLFVNLMALFALGILHF